MKLSQEHLRRDFAADAVLAAARGRRRKRMLRQGAVAMSVLAAAGFLAFALRPTPSVPIDLVEDPVLPKVERISDEELLSILSDQNPILVDMGDGHKQLVLGDPLIEKDLVFVE